MCLIGEIKSRRWRLDRGGGGVGDGWWCRASSFVACDDDCDDELLVHGPHILALDGGRGGGLPNNFNHGVGW